MRLRGRFIPCQVILEFVDTFEIIEEYSEDKYLLSYLVYFQHQGLIFHVLFSVDVQGNNVRIITAYRPNPDEWEEDMKTRRKIP